MPNARDLEALPLILCGPILRTVEQRFVSVFVALKESASVTLRVLGSTGQGASEIANTIQSTTPIGIHLHVLLVSLNLPEPEQLKPGINYGYTLHFETGAGQSTNLESLGLLSGDDRLSYDPHYYPSFSLPPADLNSVSILHGSCRKPHGDGEDMLAELDSVADLHISDAVKRPHLLLLTGDQIYADDVAPPLLRTLPCRYSA